MNRLSFEIRASDGSNDHQVRILVDDRDFLGEQYLGIDPPEFFAQFDADRCHLLIGRCLCGWVGCGDHRVSVKTADDFVDWMLGETVIAQFERAEYDRSIRNAAEDHSWETPGRRIERLVGAMLDGMVTDDGKRFEWASTRWKPGALSLHFVKDVGLPTYAYNLVHVSWDGATEESALRAARTYYSEHCV